MLSLRIPCSPEQIEVIADHFMYGDELGVQPDERAWIIAQVKKQHPTGRVKAADLDAENGEWVVDVEVL